MFSRARTYTFWYCIFIYTFLTSLIFSDITSWDIVQHILSLTMVLFNGIKDCHHNILEFSYGDRTLLRPPFGVREPHPHQSYKHCVIGAIPSQTYRWKCILVVSYTYYTRQFTCKNLFSKALYLPEKTLLRWMLNEFSPLHLVPTDRV